jgi:glycosyltransferase involved in cell wall biosynthesis
MKIGIDGIPLSAAKTGVGHYTYEVARALAVAQPQEEFQVVSQIPFVTTAIESTEPRPGNLAFIHETVNAVTKHWWTLGLPLYIRRNSIDLFHGTNYDVPAWGGVPTVLTIHDLSLLLYSETHEERRVKRARRRLPVMVRLATRIIVPTDSVRGEVCEHLSVDTNKVVVIPEAPRRCFHPVEPESARVVLNRLSIEDSFVLYVGAIEPRKNLITLVRAMEEVYTATTLRPQLVIAGPTGWLSDDLFAHVATSLIKDRIVLTGYLGDEDLRALYSVCSVMCYPALYEGAGLPPLEAMACGAPVITSDARAVVEMSGDGARTVAALDYGALAQSIVELLTDVSARKQLVSRGLNRAAQFTWERAAAMTYETYLEAVAAHRR